MGRLSTYNKGGEYVCYELICGQVMRGSSREVNNKVKMHKRLCDICRDAKDRSGIVEKITDEQEARNARKNTSYYAMNLHKDIKKSMDDLRMLYK